MTSIKIFKNHDSQNLENDVNKFLKGYENYITSVSLMTYIKDSLPIFVALVIILEEKIPPVSAETDSSS
jgi:hypothetical protein